MCHLTEALIPVFKLLKVKHSRPAGKCGAQVLGLCCGSDGTDASACPISLWRLLSPKTAVLGLSLSGFCMSEPVDNGFPQDSGIKKIYEICVTRKK